MDKYKSKTIGRGKVVTDCYSWSEYCVQGWETQETHLCRLKETLKEEGD
jgi:hypothetical protein